MKLIFAGTPAIAAQALQRLSAEHEVVLVITREDAPFGRKRELQASPVAKLADELGLKVLKRNRLLTSDAELISAAGAELAIVVAYGALIPQRQLDQLPWWNLHYSLLPMWRGATPLQHSMLNGGEGAGITLFELEAGLDTGPVIASTPMAIDYSKTCGEQLVEFTQAGVELMLQALEARPTPTPQQGKVTLAPKLTRADSKLDFSKTADQVAHQVMALNPEPMAWCNAGESPLRILRAASLGKTNWGSFSDGELTPGMVGVSSGRVLVGCAAGTLLELREVQPAGKKPMSAGDWYRGLSKEMTLD